MKIITDFAEICDGIHSPTGGRCPISIRPTRTGGAMVWIDTEEALQLAQALTAAAQDQQRHDQREYDARRL